MLNGKGIDKRQIGDEWILDTKPPRLRGGFIKYILRHPDDRLL